MLPADFTEYDSQNCQAHPLIFITPNNALALELELFIRHGLVVKTIHPQPPPLIGQVQTVIVVQMTRVRTPFGVRSRIYPLLDGRAHSAMAFKRRGRVSLRPGHLRSPRLVMVNYITLPKIIRTSTTYQLSITTTESPKTYRQENVVGWF